MKKKNTNSHSGLSLEVLWQSGDYVGVKRTSHGRKTRHLISLVEHVNNPKSTFQELKLYTSKQQALLHHVFDDAESKRKKIRVFERPGHAGLSHILPDGTVLGAPVYSYLKYRRLVGQCYRPVGTLDEAKKLFDLAKGNPIFMLVLIVSLTAPCMEWMGMSNVIVQIVGLGGGGKSTMATAAAALWRGPTPGNPKISMRWNGTPNKLTRQAAMHSGTGSAIDETATARRTMHKAQAYLEALTELVGDGGRGRLTEEVLDEWLKTFISTSNVTTYEIAEVAGTQDDFVDFLGRVIDIKEQNGDALEELHGHENVVAFSIVVNRIALGNHGQVGRAFIKAMLEANQKDKDWCKNYLLERCARYKRRWNRTIGQQQDDRIHQRFAQFYAVGLLARQLKILDWEWEDIFDAISHTERLHRKVLEGSHPDRRERTTTKGFKEVVNFVEQNYDQFYRIDLTKAVPDSMEETAYKGFDNGTEILLTNAQLKEIVGSEGALRRMHKDPAFQAAILADSNAYSVKRPLGKKARRIQVLAFKRKVFELDE